MTGFTVEAVVPEPPATVFEYFVQPGLMADWFVVDGFSTPADRLRLDPRPGGAINGLMVALDGTTEVPFEARYGRLDPPTLVELQFTDPEETVVLTLGAVGNNGTRLSYHNPTGSRDAVEGAEGMLLALVVAVEGRRKPDLTGLIKGLALPTDFTAPAELVYDDLRARAITRADLADDVAGINRSLELIRRTRGGNWPTGPVTPDDNYVDLVWHECEFRDHKSFTYAVYHASGPYLGCCYLYPVGLRAPLTESLRRHDVDVSWWVTPEAYDDGHYQTLHRALQHWTTTAYPFQNPYYSNRALP